MLNGDVILLLTSLREWKEVKGYGGVLGKGRGAAVGIIDRFLPVPFLRKKEGCSLFKDGLNPYIHRQETYL